MQDFPIEIEPIDESPKARAKKNVTSIIIVLLVVILAIASALVVRYTMLSTIIVEGISMYPTLDGGSGSTRDNDPSNGETLLLYKLGSIERGDIVVFTAPEDWGMLDSSGKNEKLVKRVIAIGGDRLEIKEGIVYLNGQVLNEDYINKAYSPMYSDLCVDVPQGYIFCMGDNRGFSTDSRVKGCVSLEQVEGKCILIKGIDGKLRKP